MKLFGLNLLNRTRTTRPRRRNQTPTTSQGNIELLEARSLLTSMIYLDFGDSFPAGGLQTTADEFNNVPNGPDLGVTGPISLGSLGSTVNALHADGDPTTTFDFNGDGVESSADTNFLKQAVFDNVVRAYEPFDVTVAFAPAQSAGDATTYLNNVRSLIDQGATTDGDRDAYVFVSSAVNSAGTSIGSMQNVKGAASLRDSPGIAETLGSNDTDESAIVFADQILADFEGTAAQNAQFELSAIAAREAATTFGTWNTWSGQRLNVLDVVSGTQNRILVAGDYSSRINGSLTLISNNASQTVSVQDVDFIANPGGNLPQHTQITVNETFTPDSLTASFLQLNERSFDARLVAGDALADDFADSAATPPIFSRYDLLSAFPVDVDGVLTTSSAPFDILAREANLGLRTGVTPTYTGTGANDVIALSRVDANTVSLTVTPYSDINHSVRIGDVLQMDIDVSNGLRIDAGGGNDIFNIDSEITASVALLGSGMNDAVILDGAGDRNAVFQPNGAESFSGVAVQNGINLSYAEFETVSAFDFADVTIRGTAFTDVLETTGGPGSTTFSGTTRGNTIAPISFQDAEVIIADLGAGADTLTINDSSLNADGLTRFTALGGPGPDRFNVAPSVHVPIFVEGENPRTTTGGDVLMADLSATTGIDVPRNQTSGRIRTSSHSPINFTGIEDLKTNTTFVLTPSGTTPTTRPEVTWTSVEGATDYEVFISNIRRQEQIAHVRVGGPATSWTPDFDLDLGTHRVWVRPTINGAATTWSAPVNFSVSVAPVGTLQTLNFNTSTPTLNWTSANDAQFFNVWLSNQTAGTSKTFQVDGSARSFTVPDELGIGVYRFSVQAVDYQNRVTPWSRFRQFNVTTRPELVRPGLATLQDPVTLEWKESLGATRYDVWVNQIDSRGNQSVFEIARDLTAVTYTLTKVPEGDFRWWVRAYNDGASGKANAASQWSEPAEFSAGDIVPEITMPRGISSGIRPTITWNDIDFIGRWEIQISSTNNQIPDIIDDQVRTNSYTPTVDLPAGDYFVWVRAISRRGEFTGWSDPVLFTTTAGRPSITAPATPTSDLLPQFEWTAVDDAVRYDLWLDVVGGTRQIIRNPNITTNSFIPFSPLDTGDYRVWVRAIAADGTSSPWSTAYNFTIVQNELTAPSASPDNPFDAAEFMFASLEGPQDELDLLTSAELIVEPVEPAIPTTKQTSDATPVAQQRITEQKSTKETASEEAPQTDAPPAFDPTAVDELLALIATSGGKDDLFIPSATLHSEES